MEGTGGEGRGGSSPSHLGHPKKRIFQVLFRKLRTPLKNLVWRTTDRAQLDWQRNSISVEIVFVVVVVVVIDRKVLRLLHDDNRTCGCGFQLNFL